MNDYISTLFLDLESLFSLSKTHIYSNEYSVIVIATLIVSLLWFIMCYGIFQKTDGGLNLYSVEYKPKHIFLEILLPIISNVILYWFSLIVISITSIFLYTILWNKFFLKFLSGHDIDIKDRVDIYRRKAKK